MEYNGYNGQIVVESDHLVITHSGIVAKGGGLVTDRPRRIPLQAISGVGFKDASRMVNGWLTIGLGGSEPPALSMGTAGSNAETVVFRHKHNEEFASLRDWLLSVVEHNQAHGVDPSTVEFDPRSTKAVRTEAKMTELLGDERPDIVAAAARMGWRMGGKRELKKLAEHLHEGETVRLIAQGTYETKQGILVLTDARLLFLFHGMMGQSKEDFPLRLISSVQTKSGMGTGELKVFVSGNSSSISGIIKTDLEAMADAVRQGMASQHAQATTSPGSTPAPVDDPYAALQKLAALRDSGVLTEEEFASKKQEILGRM